MSPGTTETRYLALLQLLRSADALWNASRTFFATWELSPSQFNILNLLRNNPAGLSQIELSRQLITHRSNITGLVERLESRNLLCRKRAPSDRRAYRVGLTDKGRKVLEEILPRYYEQAERVWTGIPGKRAADLLRDLQHVTRNAQTISGE